MNWINQVVRPKIRNILRKKEVPDNLWVKCPETGQMIYYKDLEANGFVVPGSNYHMRMSAEVRLKSLFDGGDYESIPFPDVSPDPLKFRDERRYTERLKDARNKTGLKDAVMVASGRLDGLKTVAAVQDFQFMGGSLGRAAGEAVVTGMRTAVMQNAPFILFAASGGARMQEGILSLMQMPRTTVAVQELREAGLPYIVVLTHPTTGGVTASYAMLGDIHIAEPGALIGFAGPRVIEQTIREQLPVGFQRAEYLLEHGMVDMVVHRHELRDTLSRLCGLLMERERGREIALPEQLNGVEAADMPKSTITAGDGEAMMAASGEAPAYKKGNGVAAASEDDHSDETPDETSAASNGADAERPRSI
ncbi:acetyl-CoA carboxylase, carboxyltransferase subunit beta [Methyloligella sp. 2.7D]|uniref:acetyl-CoA carboxylase, carboxyltransferase subunit beta n=1 Tax=unclassified Methyloligella TaxID=2625955 RepID=UPI00157E29D1|nr:acetyl-CoA carboxylase, carboxyltransferase subunit beta [Methyloligella sp. GL2]QKP76060.1 acetyl-CoA carboxylase carboxyltransferase subunit beta [Methyloligella sp. GL2]